MPGRRASFWHTSSCLASCAASSPTDGSRQTAQEYVIDGPSISR